MSDNVPQRDSVSAAIKRNLSLKRLLGHARRLSDCYRTRGLEATLREVTFRIALATHSEIWMYRADIPLKKELKEQRLARFDKMPKISVIVPVYNPPKRYFIDLLNSVVNQSYQNYELFLVDAGDYSSTRKILTRFKSDRIKHICIENEGISENTTKGLTEATGDILTLLDHDDLLYKNALYEIVKAYNETGAELIYSDEIILSADLKRLSEFHFKPDYSPHYLSCCNYITHLTAFTRDLIKKAGCYELKEYEGAGDFDLILRLSEKANKIHHIPKILYFWRGHEGSTAANITAKPYAIAAGARASSAHFDRIGRSAEVSPIEGRPGAYRPRYINVSGSISVIIPNYEHKEDLSRCLMTLYDNAGVSDFEVIVVENNSSSQEIFDYYDEATKLYDNLKVIKYEGEFNFSAVCNYGAREANGDHILLLNNDIEVVSAEFLRELLSYSSQNEVGAVGAKLYYPNETIQHAGVFVGIAGSAGHSHKGHPADSGGDMYRLSTVQNLLAVTGACLMVKRKLYFDHDGLNEIDFAIAFNDVDFCLRLCKAGYQNVMTPFAEAYHHESLSRGSDDSGANNKRFLKERDNLRNLHSDIYRDGDPYYNPHLTLENESYGWK